jgi:hypothetical protein
MNVHQNIHIIIYCMFFILSITSVNDLNFRIYPNAGRSPRVVVEWAGLRVRLCHQLFAPAELLGYAILFTAIHWCSCWCTFTVSKCEIKSQIVGFEVPTTVVKCITFWDIIPCSQLSVDRRFGGTYRLHLQGSINELSKKPTWKQMESRNWWTFCFIRVYCPANSKYQQRQCFASHHH